jgi:hypothetical protein
VEGTIQYTVENIGRTLLRVDFDCGTSLMVLPDDIELDPREAPSPGHRGTSCTAAIAKRGPASWQTAIRRS